MSLLRHPVVITSLEEDFRKIGLIPKNRLDEEVNSQEVEDQSAEEEPQQGAEAEESVEDVEATDDMDEEAEFELDDDEMAELEGFAESVEERELDQEDIEEESEETDTEDEEDVEVVPANSFESVAGALREIESLISEDSEEVSLESAIPAFAEMALLSEKLYGYFVEMSIAHDDVEYSEIAEIYKKVAQYSDGVVSTLQEEDAATIDMAVLKETFQEYLATVLEGVETYAILQESEELEETDDEEDSDEDEQEEGKE